MNVVTYLTNQAVLNGRRITAYLKQPLVARRARLAVTALTIGYLVTIIAVGVGALQATNWTPYVTGVLIGFALYPASVVVQALAWALAVGFLRRLDWEFSWRDIQAFALSYMLRRLPGGIWQITGRVVTYRGQNVHASQPITASVAELALSTVAAGSLYVSFGLLRDFGTITDVVVALVITGIAGAIIGQILARAPWIRRESAILGKLNRGSVVYVTIGLLYLTGYAVASCILYYMVLAGGSAHFSLGEAAGVWGLTSLISTVILLVPVGMGIREVTLTVLLSPVTGRVEAVVVAILLRLLFIAGDLAWGAALVAGANWVASVRFRNSGQNERD